MPQGPTPGQRTIVVDNGGHTVKVGFAQDKYPKVFPNCAVRPKREKRLYIGDQLDQIIDYSNLFYRRPISKGYVTNCDLEAQIWGRTFGKQILNADTTKCSLVLTEPPFNPLAIQKDMDEVVFEKFGFASMYRGSCASLALDGCHRQLRSSVSCSSGRGVWPGPIPRTALVIDCGFSFTHVTPVFDGVPFNYATKRLDIGGKLLTNYLKEMVSYRAWNMMEETYLLEDVKTKLCYVATDFDADLEMARGRDSKIAREYILPGSTSQLGRVKSLDEEQYSAETQQCLRLNNERFSVPELLFNPGDVGMHSAGLPEAIVRAVEATPAALHGIFYKSIVLVGGSTLIPNVRTRLQNELRAMVPSDFELSITHAPKPINAAWHGAALLGQSENFARQCVTKAQYQEFGQSICLRKFY